MIYHVKIGDMTRIVEVRRDGVTLDGTPLDVDFEEILGVPVRSLLLGGRSHRVSARRVGSEEWEVHLGGRRVSVSVVEARTQAIRETTVAKSGPSGPNPIVAPMPGMVVRVDVAEGDIVEAGQGVVIMEAMKMENELTAEAQGVVSKIHIEEGQAVEKGKVLVDLLALDLAENDV